MDKFVEQLMITGRATVELSGTCSPLLIGAQGGEELLSLIIPRENRAEDDFIRYQQALTLVLFAGSDTVYELRDVFIRTHDIKEMPEDVLPPREDPEADNAILVVRTPVDGDATSYVRRYSIGDKGEVSFGEVEETPEQEMARGAYGTVLGEMLERWKQAGRKVVELQEISRMRAVVGFLGRVKGE